MDREEVIKRYIIFIIGIIFTALGISIITTATLGTSPITSIAYVLTFAFPLSLGVFTFITNMIFIAGQIILLKKDFKKIQYLQVLMTVILSFFIDIFMEGLNTIPMNTYIVQIVTLLLGCFVLALGISLQIIGNVLVTAAEGLVQAIAYKANKEFGSVKTLFDISLVTISVIASFFLTGKLEGIREGTIISAILTGFIVKVLTRKLTIYIQYRRMNIPKVNG